MNSKTKFAFALGFVLVASILLASPASAGKWRNRAMKLDAINSILSNGDNYNLVWEGELYGGQTTITLNGGKQTSALSALSNLDLNSGNFDILSFEKNNVGTFSSSTISSPRYGNGFWGSSRGYGSYGRYGGYNSNSNNRNYFNDNSERLFIDNTQNNAGRNAVAITGIVTAGDVINTGTLAQADITNTKTITNRDIKLAGFTERGATDRANIFANRDIQVANSVTHGETERTRFRTERDSDIANSRLEEVKARANRDIKTTETLSDNDVEKTRVLTQYELDRTKLILNPYSGYNYDRSYYDKNNYNRQYYVLR